MCSRFIKSLPISRAEEKFAKYLRTLGYKLSVQVLMRYEEFEPKFDKVIEKCHLIDIVLDEQRWPIELLGPHHLKQRQELKDERIFKEIERQYRKKPVLIRYNGREPSFKRMREWHKLVQAHLTQAETIAYWEM